MKGEKSTEKLTFVLFGLEGRSNSRAHELERVLRICATNFPFLASSLPSSCYVSVWVSFREFDPLYFPGSRSVLTPTNISCFFLSLLLDRRSAAASSSFVISFLRQGKCIVRNVQIHCGEGGQFLTRVSLVNRFLSVKKEKKTGRQWLWKLNEKFFLVKRESPGALPLCVRKGFFSLYQTLHLGEIEGLSVISLTRLPPLRSWVTFLSPSFPFLLIPSP